MKMQPADSHSTVLGPGFDVSSVGGYVSEEFDHNMADLESTAQSPARPQEVIEETSGAYSTVPSEGASQTESVGRSSRSEAESEPIPIAHRLASRRARTTLPPATVYKLRRTVRTAPPRVEVPSRAEVGRAFESLQSGISDARARLDAATNQIGAASQDAATVHEQLSRIEAQRAQKERETAEAFGAVDQRVQADKAELLKGLQDLHRRGLEERASQGATLGALERKAQEDVNRLTADVAHVTHKAATDVQVLNLELQEVRKNDEAAHLKLQDLSQNAAVLRHEVTISSEDTKRQFKLNAQKWHDLEHITMRDINTQFQARNLEIQTLRAQMQERESDMKDVWQSLGDIRAELDRTRDQLNVTRDELAAERAKLAKERAEWQQKKAQEQQEWQSLFSAQDSDTPFSDVTPPSAAAGQTQQTAAGGQEDIISLSGGISGGKGPPSGNGNGSDNSSGHHGRDRHPGTPFPGGGGGNGPPGGSAGGSGGFGGDFPPPPMHPMQYPSWNVPPQPVHAPAQFQLKLKDPPSFNGNPETDVDTWLLSVDDNLAVSHTDGIDGVNYMACLLVGDAKSWWHQHVRAHGRPVTVAAMKDAMRERFGSDLREKRARAALRNISIKAGENIRSYSSRFTSNLEKLPGHEAAWALEQYITGLPPRVAEAITLAGIKTLPLAIKKAEEVELVHNWTHGGARGQTAAATAGRGRGRFSGKSTWTGSSGRGNTSQFSSGPQVGQGFRGRGRGFQSRGGAPKQGQGHGNCYICGKAGHWSNNCPQRTSGRGRGRGVPHAARGRGRSVPSRTALNCALGSVAEEEDLEVGDTDAPTAAEFSRNSEN